MFSSIDNILENTSTQERIKWTNQETTILWGRDRQIWELMRVGKNRRDSPFTDFARQEPSLQCLENRLPLILTTILHGAMDCDQNSCMLVWRCHQLLSGFLTNDHLPRVAHQSPNDKGDNEIKPGVCVDLAFDKKKTSAKRPPDEGCHRLKWASLLLNEIGGITQHVR
jgi:hypothetical protein